MDQRSRDGKISDDLMTSPSIGGHRFQNFEILNAKIASALRRRTSRTLTSRRECDCGGAKGINARPIFSVEDRLRK